MYNGPGIYSITNTVTGVVYVGSAVRIYRRFYHHRWWLKRRQHVNAYLQASWDKHGPGAFVFSLLEECEAGHLLAREQWWIDNLQANGDGGYNFASAKRGPHPNLKASRQRKQRWDGMSKEERLERSKQLTTEVVRKGNSERLKERWKNPEFRAKRLAGLERGRAKTNARKDPAILANLVAGRAKAIARNKSDPVLREQRRASARAKWQDPAFRARAIASLDAGRIKTNLRKKEQAAARRAGNDIV